MQPKRPLAILAFSLLLTFVPSDVFSQTRYNWGAPSISVKSDGVPIRDRVFDHLGRFEISGETRTWVGERKVFTISVAQLVLDRKLLYGNNLTTTLRTEAIRAMERSLREKLFANRPVNTTPYTYGRSTGIAIENTDRIWKIARVFFYEGLLITVIASAEDQADKASLIDSANSFRPLTKNERVLALMEESLPQPLPRELPTLSFFSDVADRGFKGRVRIVRDHEKRANEPEFLSELRFDNAGFLETEVGFSSGFPEVIVAWGWVKGERVDLEVSANYFPGMKPFYGGRMIISGQRGFYTVDEITAAAEGRSKVDLRYGTKYNDEHDQQGRIVSRVRRTNNGNLLTTQKFEYGEDSKTIRTFDESNNFFSHTVEKIDKNGNVLETRSLSETGTVLSSHRYEYKFDSVGNWIERRDFVRSTGKVKGEKLLRTVFREITYYPEATDRNVAWLATDPIVQVPQDNRSAR